MAFSNGPKSIVQDGLVFATDAGNTLCYTSGSATATDIVGNTTLTLNNGTAPPIQPYNNSWRFDGTDDYIDSTTGPTLPVNSSFSCWFNPDSYGNYNGIVTSPNYGTGGYNNTWSIQLMADKRFRWMFYNGTSVNQAYISNVPDYTGTWNNLVITTESASPYPFVRLYINTVFIHYNSVTHGQTSPLADVSNGIIFGTTGISGEDFDGFIGCMLLYTKTLSSAEMLQNYNATKNRFQ